MTVTEKVSFRLFTNTNEARAPVPFASVFHVLRASVQGAPLLHAFVTLHGIRHEGPTFHADERDVREILKFLLGPNPSLASHRNSALDQVLSLQV